MMYVYQNYLRTLHVETFSPLFTIINNLYKNKNHKDIKLDEYIQHINYWIENNPPSFDCRIMQSDKKDIDTYIGWRRVDAIRNYKNMFGHVFYSSKSMHQMTADDVVKKVNQEYHIDYRSFPSMMKCGNFYQSEKFKDYITHDFQDDEITLNF